MFELSIADSQQVDAITARLWGIGVDSHKRLEVMLWELAVQPSDVFWPVFLKVWSTCDGTWPRRSILLSYLRHHHALDPGPSYLQGDDRAFYASLPDLVRVYRDCARPRVRAVSWSTDPEVAVSFARGHRWIRVPDPVVASALIPKTHVFSVSVERQESEVLLDPRRLRKFESEAAERLSEHPGAEPADPS